MIAVRALISIFLMLGTLAFGSDAEAKATYTILPAGYGAVSINDSGAVTGGDGASGGFLRTPDGLITTFRVPGDTFGTVAVSINADDEIAGYYEDESHVTHGFLRAADGSVTTFDAPGAGTTGGQGTTVAGVNREGTVTGTYLDSIGKEQLRADIRWRYHRYQGAGSSQHAGYEHQ